MKLLLSRKIAQFRLLIKMQKIFVSVPLESEGKFHITSKTLLPSYNLIFCKNL